MKLADLVRRLQELLANDPDANVELRFTRFSDDGDAQELVHTDCEGAIGEPGKVTIVDAIYQGDTGP